MLTSVHVRFLIRPHAKLIAAGCRVAWLVISAWMNAIGNCCGSSIGQLHIETDVFTPYQSIDRVKINRTPIKPHIHRSPPVSSLDPIRRMPSLTSFRFEWTREERRQWGLDADHMSLFRSLPNLTQLNIRGRKSMFHNDISPFNLNELRLMAAQSHEWKLTEMSMSSPSQSHPRLQDEELACIASIPSFTTLFMEVSYVFDFTPLTRLTQLRILSLTCDPRYMRDVNTDADRHREAARVDALTSALSSLHQLTSLSIKHDDHQLNQSHLAIILSHITQLHMLKLNGCKGVRSLSFLTPSTPSHLPSHSPSSSISPSISQPPPRPRPHLASTLSELTLDWCNSIPPLDSELVHVFQLRSLTRLTLECSFTHPLTHDQIASISFTPQSPSFRMHHRPHLNRVRYTKVSIPR